MHVLMTVCAVGRNLQHLIESIIAETVEKWCVVIAPV
jgi:hypothetical protein